MAGCATSWGLVYDGLRSTEHISRRRGITYAIAHIHFTPTSLAEGARLLMHPFGHEQRFYC